MLSREMAMPTPAETASKAPRAAVAAVIVALAVTACGISNPDPAACKAALQAQYVKATAGQGNLGTQPSACNGLPKAEVQRFARQVMNGA